MTTGASVAPGPEKGESARAAAVGGTAVESAAAAATARAAAPGDAPAQPARRVEPLARAPPLGSQPRPPSVALDERRSPSGDGGGRANRAPSPAPGSDSSYEGLYLDPLSMRDPDVGFRIEGEIARPPARKPAVTSESDVTSSSETRNPSENPTEVKIEAHSSAVPRSSLNSAAPRDGTADADRDLEGHILQAYQELYRVREETDAEIEAAIRRLQRTQSDAQRRYQRIGDALNHARLRAGVSVPPSVREQVSVPIEDGNIEAAVRGLRGPRREDEDSEAYGRRVAAREREERERAANRAPRVEWRHAPTSEERLRNAGFDVGESASRARGEEPDARGRRERRRHPGGSSPSGSDDSSSDSSSEGERPRRRSRSRSRESSDDDEDEPPARPGAPLSAVGIRRTRHEARPSRLPAPDVRGVADPVTIDYESGAVRWIRDIIRDQVGEPLPAVPELKHVKPSPPEKYDGSDDTEVFEDWVKAVLRWMRILSLAGPALDSHRVLVLGTLLTGPALRWYNQEVAAPYRTERHWSFEKVMCAMYRRFIHQATAQEATAKFESVRYDARKGAAAYYGDLKHHASRMVLPPDEYTFRRRYMNGLPEHIVTELTRGRGLSAENADEHVLLQETIRIENALQYLRGWERSNRGHRVSQDGPSQGSSRPRDSRDRRDRPSKKSRDERSRRRDRHSAKDRSHRHRSRERQDRHRSRPEQRSGDSRPSASRPFAPRKTTGDRNRCYACGGEGHYANDPKCPKYPRANVRRIAADAPGDQDTREETAPAEVERDPSPEEPSSAESGEEDDQSVDGSQYDSASEYTLGRYEDYDDASVTGASSTASAYLRAMRVGRPRRAAMARAFGRLPRDPPADTAASTSTAATNREIRWPLLDSTTYQESRRRLAPDQFDAQVRQSLDRLHERIRSGTQQLAHEHDTVDYLVALALSKRRADAYNLNPGRVPIDQLEVHPEFPNELERDRRLDYLEAIIHQLLAETSELRTEIWLLELAVQNDLPRWLIDDLVGHAYRRERRRSGWWDRFGVGQDLTQESGDIDEDVPIGVDITMVDDFLGLDTDSEPEEEHVGDGAFAIPATVLGPEDREDRRRDSRSGRYAATVITVTDDDDDDREDSPPPLQAVSDSSDTDDSSDEDEDPLGFPAVSTPSPPNSPPGSPTPRPPRRLTVMTVELRAKTSDVRPQRAAMHAAGEVANRPRQPDQCMMVYCQINGLKAKALVDSGSTINCVSPDFVRVAKVPTFILSEPVGLQLGCVGSRSRINFGARASVTLGSGESQEYFDVVNLDHYDVILGIPFLRTHGIVLDFGANTLRYGTGAVVPALRGEERPVRRDSSGPSRRNATKGTTPRASRIPVRRSVAVSRARAAASDDQD